MEGAAKGRGLFGLHRYHRAAVYAAVFCRRRTAYRTVMWDTAATSAATTAAMAAYPTNVTINENVAAPPAPAVTNSQAEAVTCLKELKSLQQQGLITAAQY